MPYAQSQDAELYYEVQGSGDPLLLIMGLGGAHAAWMLQVRSFRKHFQVITYDPRGLGLSRDSGEPYTMRTLADDAVAILDHLQIERSHILGMSLGGMVAQEVAIAYPDRVRKLVLAATSPGGPRQISPAMREALRIPEDIGLSQILSAGDAGPTVNMKQAGAIVTRLSFNCSLLPWAMMRLARRQGSRALPDGAQRQTQASGTHDTRDRLHLIQAPTLVIVGSRDRIIPPHASEVLAEGIPNATLEVLRGAPHALNFETFWRFNPAVIRFLTNA
jgi:pimeloyl-ACP methyl ester carboxylesterase